ncbi:MFS transporter [Brevibacillus humidisoli]|uniref:MFS transporter n=1 Tax=Brevibacillus humidisoli TaxID=2895522 RepID=UPI001E4BF837|nr:MFS transporter [Brevibacillus humidisoli]UFJ42563.1 MFS transporter [Brevibacillus humidisoli]
MTEAEQAKTATRMLRIFILCAFLVGLDSLIVGPLVPVISDDLAFQPELGGLLVTAYGLLFGLAAPLFGPISDRWGRKQMILLGMFVFSIGTALTAVATDLTTSLIYRGIAGLGGAMCMPSIYALIGDTFSNEKRGKAMGLITGAIIGSQVLGIPAGTFMAKVGSWQISFWAIAALGLLAFLIVLVGIAKTPARRQIPVGPVKAYMLQFKTAFTIPSVLFALLCTFLWTAGLQGMFAYVGVYYEENFGLEVNEIGIVAMFAAAVSVIGSVIGGRMSDKVGRKTMIGIASVMSAIGVLVFSTMTQSFWGAFISQLFWAGFVGIGQATLTALISELNPSVRGTIMSLNSSALYLGMMASTAVAAAMLQSGLSYLAVGIMCAISAILVMPLTMYLVKEGSEPAAPETTTAK